MTNATKTETKSAIPPIGTRYAMNHGRGMLVVIEYVGLNPRPMFESADAHRMRYVEFDRGLLSGSASPVGETFDVEPMWFQTHAKETK